MKMPKGSQQQRWYDIEPGTRPAQCEACDEQIFFALTKNNAKMPVSCDVDGGHEPSAPGCAPSMAYAGRGISHFQNCTHPEKFSGRHKR